MHAGYDCVWIQIRVQNVNCGIEELLELFPNLELYEDVGEAKCFAEGIPLREEQACFHHKVTVV